MKKKQIAGLIGTKVKTQIIIKMTNRKQKGNQSLYGEKTVVLPIKVPESKKEEIKEKFYAIMDGYNKAYIESIEVKTTTL